MRPRVLEPVHVDKGAAQLEGANGGVVLVLDPCCGRGFDRGFGRGFGSKALVEQRPGVLGRGGHVAIDDGLGFANLGQGRKLHDSSIANVIDGHTIELQLNHGRLRLMDLKIRRAVPEDALSIALVQVESWRKTYAEIVPQDFLASLDEEERAAMWKEGLQAGGMFLFVAEDEWGIFGFISGGEIREPIPGYDAELYAIYLLPARQRRGVGQELALTLREALLMESFSSMVVWALEGNLPGVSFYKRIGGIQIGQRTIEIGGAVLPELAFGWPVL